VGANSHWAWFCFSRQCKVWAQTEEAMESHVHSAHGVARDEIRRLEHYGNKEERTLFLRQRDQDIEDAAQGFSKWLDSLSGADDFLYETGGL